MSYACSCLYYHHHYCLCLFVTLSWLIPCTLFRPIRIRSIFSASYPSLCFLFLLVRSCTRWRETSWYGWLIFFFLFDSFLICVGYHGSHVLRSLLCSATGVNGVSYVSSPTYLLMSLRSGFLWWMDIWAWHGMAWYGVADGVAWEAVWCGVVCCNMCVLSYQPAWPLLSSSPFLLSSISRRFRASSTTPPHKYSPLILYLHSPLLHVCLSFYRKKRQLT